MKEKSNRGILIAILVCLILLVLNNNNADPAIEFPYQIETTTTDDRIFPLGDNKIVTYTSWGDITVFEWDEANKTFNRIAFNEYEEYE